MTSDASRIVWKQVRKLLESARELPPADREEFLRDRCVGNSSIRRQVESLIGHGEQPTFLETPRDFASLLLTINLEGQRLGSWMVERRLAAGGMGAVYLAHRADGQFQKQVAIKVVRHRIASAAGLRRFQLERQILAAVEDPGIARLLDAGTTEEGLPYLVMEYVEGEPIDCYCEAGELSTAERMRLFRRVCGAVQVAHDARVVHRDIKPANVLVTGDGGVKLLDFGIAKLLAPELMDVSVERTAEFERLMTPSFASPEQVRGEPVNEATDVYSLGVVVYRMLTGRHPYDVAGASADEVARAVCGAVPAPPSRVGGARDVPAGRAEKLDAIVLKALAKEPADRYSSASALADAIDEWAAKKQLPAPCPVPVSTTVRTEPGDSEGAGDGAADNPNADVSPGRRTWGELEITEKVGEGQFGEVFRCRDHALDRDVALKLFRPPGSSGGDEAWAPSERSFVEGRLLASVTHPNVVKVHGIAERDGEVGLWMEFIEGTTLADLLRLQGRFSAGEARRIGGKLCGALAAMHGRGLIHRDIKAQNVMREEGGRIVLMDFGAGRDLAGDRGDRRPAGTPLYMAPELLHGEAATPRSDLYSLGVLLCHLVTSAFPVKGRSLKELIEKHDSGEIPMVRDLRADLPPRFADAVQRAIDPDPTRRFASAGEMQRELELAGGLTLPAPEPRADDDDTSTGELSGLAKMISDLTTFGENFKRVATYLGSAVAAFLFVVFLGYIGASLKRIALRVPSGYELENALSYLRYGVGSLFEPVAAALLGALTFAAALVVARRVATGMSRTAGRSESIRRVYDALGGDRDILRTHPKRTMVITFALGVVGCAAMTFALRDMLNTFPVLTWGSGTLEDRLALMPLEDYAFEYKRLYTSFLAALLVVLGFAAVAAFRAGAAAARTDRDFFWLKAGIVLTLLYPLTLSAIPWPLLLESQHPAVIVDDAKWFVVARSSTHYLLYSWDTQERDLVERSDPRFAPENLTNSEFIFGGDRMTTDEILNSRPEAGARTEGQDSGSTGTSQASKPQDGGDP